jgi:hypothetical protein
VLPRWQHRAIWGFAASNIICDPDAVAVLAGRSRWMPTCDGAATAAAPCHLGICPSAGNPRLGESLPRTAALIDQRWREMITVHGCATVAPPSHLEFYRKPENQFADATCGPSKIYLPFCAEDRAFAIVLSATVESRPKLS